MFDKWEPIHVVEVYGDTADVIEHKNGEYRLRHVEL
jgi:hypothetical protein